MTRESTAEEGARMSSVELTEMESGERMKRVRNQDLLVTAMLSRMTGIAREGKTSANVRVGWGVRGRQSAAVCLSGPLSVRFYVRGEGRAAI